jgi:hypothetical protein
MVTRYTAEPDVHPFEYEVNGAIINYRLIVINGSDRDKYIKEIRKRTKKDAQGRVEVVDMDGLTAMILTLAAQRNHGTEDHPEWKPVPLAELQAWPAPMQTELNEKALAMSGLDKKGPEEAKND